MPKTMVKPSLLKTMHGIAQGKFAISEQTFWHGTVLKVSIEDENGEEEAKNYMGIMEHLEARQDSATTDPHYQQTVYAHHKRCFDAVLGRPCCHNYASHCLHPTFELYGNVHR